MFYRNENDTSTLDTKKQDDATTQYTQPIGDTIDTINSSMYDDIQSMNCPFMNRQRPSYPAQQQPYPRRRRRRRNRRRRRPFPFFPFVFAYPYHDDYYDDDYYDDYYDDYDDYYDDYYDMY